MCRRLTVTQQYYESLTKKNEMSVSRRHILDETPLKKNEMSVSRRHILDETPVKMCRRLTVTQQYYESLTPHHFSFFIFTVHPIVQTDWYNTTIP